jgi:uncharacterized membrane protein
MGLGLEWPLVLLPGGVLLATLALCWMLPALGPAGVLFGVPVGPRAAEGPAGRSAVRLYRAALVSGACVPLVLWGLGLSRRSVGLLLLAALSLIPEILTAYLLGHVRARALAGAGEVAPSPAPAHRPALGTASPGQALGSPLRSFLHALPYGLLLFTGLLLVSRYQSLPDPFPVHTGLSGRPDRWMPKSPTVVFLAPAVGFCLLLLLDLVQGLVRSSGWVRRGVDGGRGARAGEDILRATQLFLGGLLAAVGLSTAGILPPDRLLAAVVLGPLLFLGWLVFFVARLVQERRTSAPWAADGMPDSAWKAGLFYLNRNDPVLLVPRRFGIGWTLNFGRPGAWLLLAVLLAAPLLLAAGVALVIR